MFPKLTAITHNTFVETIRQPIYGVLLWVFAGFLMLSPSLSAFTLESGGDIKVMKDVGFATMLLYGLLASVFAASSVITREIESHTVLTVVSKPVARPVFLAGKYLGVCGAVLVGYYFLCLVFLMTVRHGTMETAADKFDQPVLVFGTLAIAISLIVAVFGNYVYGWHFLTTLTAWVVPLGTAAVLGMLFFDKEWKPQPPLKDFGDMQVLYAVAMTYCGVLILTAFAVALATRFSQVMTLILCFGVYLIGLLSDHYFGQAAVKQSDVLYQVLYGIVPNFQFFWVGDAITQEVVIPGSQVVQVAVYAGLYSLAILGLGVAMFETREVG